MTHLTELQDVMTVNPVIVDADTRLDDAIRILNNYSFRHLPVVSCDRLIGILSDRDLRLATSMWPEARRLFDDDGNPVPGPKTVREVMHEDVRWASPTDGIRDAAKTLASEQIGALPVLEDGRVVGIVTETNVLDAFVRGCTNGDCEDDQVRHHLNAEAFEVDPECTVVDALERMDPRARHLIVVEDGSLKGILSERDLLMGLSRSMIRDARAQEAGQMVETMVPVRQVMSTRIVTVEPDVPLSAAARTMLGHRFSALPVLESTLPVGVLTQRDVLVHYAR